MTWLGCRRTSRARVRSRYGEQARRALPVRVLGPGAGRRSARQQPVAGARTLASTATSTSFDDNSGKAKTVVVQVKSGQVQRNIVATLKGDMEREKAEMGLLVTLEPPTRPMELGSCRRRFLRAGALPGPPVPACADRDHRGPAERQRAGRAAPRPRGRADVPPRRAASELGGRCTAAAVRGQGFPFGPSMGSGRTGNHEGRPYGRAGALRQAQGERGAFAPPGRPFIPFESLRTGFDFPQ